MSIRQRITVLAAYKELHQQLNSRQLTALRRLADYKIYINSPLGIHGKEYIRTDQRDNDQSSVRNYVIANSQQKYKMHLAISTRGKIYNYTIYKNTGTDGDKTVWSLVKHYNLTKD